MSIVGVSAEQLKQFIEKIERLEEEKEEVSTQIKEVLAMAKSEGFEIKIMRQIIKMRKMKREDLVEQQELLEVYAQALGLPVGA